MEILATTKSSGGEEKAQERKQDICWAIFLNVESDVVAYYLLGDKEIKEAMPLFLFIIFLTFTVKLGFIILKNINLFLAP